MEDLRSRIDNPWGERTPYVGSWPSRVDSFQTDQPDHWVQSACVLCSNGCALDIGVKEGVIVGVRGRGADRVNLGRLGPKGLYGWEANASPDRLRHPLIRRGSALEPASWEEAMSLVVRRAKEIVRESTAQAIGIYTSGQLFLEDYYAISMVARAGLGTPHLDGNTRLCTATASEALKESFGADGQPGSFSDFDSADTIFLVGQNMAETKTVLWSRILDRRMSPKPPRLIVADPRKTLTAQQADVHLQLRAGTNLALMQGLLHLIIESDRLDHRFLREHTTGLEGLKEAVLPWTAEKTEEATGVPAALIRRAAEMLSSADRLVSTVLQGVYQSHQATASAVQVNNLHLLRGMIGKPGCSVFQMNGQPTAQNTRETGCDGGMPAFRNWENPDHMRDLARVWNVEPERIAHWGPPTPVLQMLRYVELGSIKMLWVCGTNPAVSLPEISRIRSLLAKRDLFLVVNDAFPTETTEFADVVLPAALWGEKTGTFTNSDRTVHLSKKAVEPPGEARSDMDIFLDFSRRMDFRDKDHAPLLKWSDSEGAFNAWRECSRGWPCDYSSLTYDKLSGGSGIQWPCTEAAPNGTERLYQDGVFATDAALCQTYGHDHATGAAIPPEKYKAANPAGRAFLRAAEVQGPLDTPNEDYPFVLTTGRLLYHFHTRTKTGRSKPLAEASPEVWVEIGRVDAERLGIVNGDLVEVESTQGKIEGPARVAELATGHLFIPFHYGWWDAPDRLRAANELTKTEWDPVSKQPVFKRATARVRKIAAYSSWKNRETKKTFTPREATPPEQSAPKRARSPFDEALGVLEESISCIAEAFTAMKERHQDDPEVVGGCTLLESWSRRHGDDLRSFAESSPRNAKVEGQRQRPKVFTSRKQAGVGLLRDLQDLFVMAHRVKIAAVTLAQAARTLRHKPLESTLSRIEFQTERQIGWIQTKLKHSAPQVLVVPP